MTTDIKSGSSFRSAPEKRIYWILLLFFVGLCFFVSYGLVIYNNPVPIDSPSYHPVVKRRVFALITMIIAAICQSLSTIAFQSITNNRIITPSLLGFEALYTTIQTSIMFFFGSTALINFTGTAPFLIQVSIMVGMSLFLFGWLLSDKYGNLQFVLLVSVIMGTGLRSISSFLRRMMSPSEFDILQARMYGSVNNASSDYFPIAIPAVFLAAALIIMYSRKLNVLSLGKDTATALGVNHRKSTVYALILVSVLMSVSTALVGPLTFYGFLVATLCYQAVPTYDHKYIFPMSLAIGFLVITGAYFLMNNVFYAQGVVSVLIELIGGLAFMIVLLRKGSL